MIEYIELGLLLLLLFEVSGLHKKADHKVHVNLSIIPMQDDWKPVYNTSTILTKQLRLSSPPIIHAVVARVGNYPATIYGINQVENYLGCYARCEVEQDSYENCIALYKELGWT